MHQFVTALRKSVETKNWHSALALALFMPDVCGKLQSPNSGSQTRYVEWFRMWVQPKYTLQMYLMPTETVFLSGEDCYALRCSYLHEGGDEIAHQRAKVVLDQFHFITPPPGGMIHMNMVNTALQLQVDIFCLDVAEAVEAWLVHITGDQEINQRMSSLIAIHDSSRGVSF